MPGRKASPQPSPKEKELKERSILIKVLSFGEDLGEAFLHIDVKQTLY
jgi:hypothetical protein